VHPSTDKARETNIQPRTAPADIAPASQCLQNGIAQLPPIRLVWSMELLSRKADKKEKNTRDSRNRALSALVSFESLKMYSMSMNMKIAVQIEMK